MKGYKFAQIILEGTRHSENSRIIGKLDSTVDDVHQADKGRQFSSRSNRVELGLS